MSILYCLNPECSHPQNPTHYRYCQGCGGNLSQTSQSYSFHSRYLIVEVLGQGAFGRTYQAKDLNFNQKPRVIKKFIAQMQGSALEKSKELFQREAEKLDELKHEQIPTVYDYFSAGNSLYLVQEFIEGETLLQEYQREGRFSEQKIKEILRELLPVLAYLHSKGLNHRDIKPDNLMRRRSDGKLMLIDFGGIKEQTSQMGIGLYTPGYAAFEHIMGRAVAASDRRFEDEEIDDGSLNVIKANGVNPLSLKREKNGIKRTFLCIAFGLCTEDLGTICLNTVECTIREGSYRFSKITRPTQLQQKALDLWGVSLICTQ